MVIFSAQVRVLVLLSLTCQVILTIFGFRRKYSRGSLISFLVWFTYLLADRVATFLLVILVDNQRFGTQDKNDALQVLWAPFILLHLGGPDTISSYSSQDSVLWLRHLFGLLVRVTMVLYIYIRPWSSNAQTFIAIPLLFSGIIKSGERIWILRTTIPSHFGEPLTSGPTLHAPHLRQIPTHSELGYVHQAHSLFVMLSHCPNLSPRFAEVLRSYSLMVKKKEWEENRDIQQQSNYAFKLVEVQLGFLYDVLYTKATIIYSLPGLIFRFMNVISIASALAALVVTIDTHDCSRVDIIVTHCLFFGAISLELYAFISLIFSDWTTCWLMENKSSLRNFIDWLLRHGHKRWSGCLAQHNILSFCQKKRVARYIRNDVLFTNYFELELHWQRTWNNVDNDLKELIFRQLQEKHRIYDRSGFDHEVLKQLLSYKGNYVLSNNNCLNEIGWSIKVKYDHSLLIWHIATNICYYSTPDKDKDDKCKVSKKLSDYMLYVLLMRPSMLPTWSNRIRHIRDTFRNVTRILQERNFNVEACAVALIQMDIQSSQPLNDQSVLHDGCRLASQLQNLRCSWEMICQVWIEMLTYAASQCKWGAHVEQLPRGGEFLTHVCILMTNLGLSQQLDMGG